MCSLINRGENPPQGSIHGWNDRLAAYERAKRVIGTGTEPVTEPAGARSELVADRITLGYDKEGWAYDTASGLYVKSNTALLDHKTNKDGWLWARVGTVVEAPPETPPVTPAPTPSAWSWYDQPWADAWAEPDPQSDIYQSRCPTRYEWRPDIEAWPRWLVDNFNVSCNTYYNHPEEGVHTGFEVASTDPDGKDWYIMNTSFDVWGPTGRNEPLGSTVGWQIFRLLMDDPNPPNIRWIIYIGRQYGAWNNWEGEFFAAPGTFMYHGDHIHVTYW